MTRQTFYRKLKQIAHKYNWYLVDGRIRARKKDYDTYYEKCFCPVSALYHEMTGEYIPIMVTSTYIGSVISLSEKDTAYITRSADNLEGHVIGNKTLKKYVGL